MYQAYISAFREGKDPAENYINTVHLLESLTTRLNTAPVGCIGCFGGEREFSFQLTLSGCVSDILRNDSMLKQLAQEFGQVSVLLVDKDEDAFLYWVQDNTLEHFGKFIQTNEATAKEVGYFTKCGENYFVTTAKPKLKRVL